MATRAEKLEAVGNEAKDNANAEVLPELEELHAKAQKLGCHAGIVDHLDECIFVAKRDIKQKELAAKAALNAPQVARGRSL